MKRIVAYASYASLAFVFVATPGLAQQEEKDNTGTNPVNFTYDLRFITEMQWFRDGGGSLLKHTLEWKAPLGADIGKLRGGRTFSDLGKRFGLRMRAYYQNLSFNDGTGNLGSSSVSGLGDIDARILWIAAINKKWGLVPGLEAFFNTASNDFLGSGSTNLAPVVFVPLFNVLGPRSLFAPGYQYVFDVAGNCQLSSADARLRTRGGVARSRHSEGQVISVLRAAFARAAPTWTCPDGRRFATGRTATVTAG